MLIQSTLCLAAQEIASIQTRYAKKGLPLSEIALCGSKNFLEWQHYPSNDLVDQDSGYEFYYHAHGSEEMPKGEHGHFHLFKRSPGNTEEFHHLVGVSLDQKGLPVRIFTTNQWVTGEVLVKANCVLQELKGFDMAVKGRMGPLSRWVSAFTKLFYLEMEMLILERDQKIIQLQSSFANLDEALNSRKHHVLTECKIDLIERLAEHLLVTH